MLGSAVKKMAFYTFVRDHNGNLNVSYFIEDNVDVENTKGSAWNFRIFCYTFIMNIKDVENLAELAKLDMSGEEKEAMLKDMDSILGYVKQIEEVEVGDVKPSYDVYNVWREDKIEPREFSKEIITEEFPDKQDGFLKVKKIL